MSADLEPYEGGNGGGVGLGGAALPERLSLPEILETAKILAASGYFPTAKEAGQAAAKIMWGQDMGLTPMQAMTGIHVWIQSGTPTMQVSAKVITYLLKRHGFTWEFAQHDAEACEVEVYRHGKRLEPNVRFTKAQAAKAGLASKSVWQGYGEDMLWHRVAGRIADRFAPEIFDAAAIPVMTTEQAESIYPDPRDDLVKALHATYREKHPRTHDADSEEYRNMRLDWASVVLGRRVLSFNGPDYPETLTRADVLTLLDALESTPALNQGQAAPISPGAPSAAGADSTAPQGSAGPSSGMTAGDGLTAAKTPAEHRSAGDRGRRHAPPISGTGHPEAPPPAEHHTAEVYGEVAPADGTVPVGESRSDTGLPPGPAPISPIGQNAPKRKRRSTDPTGAPGVKEAMREAQQFRDDRRTQTEVERTPADPILSMPPKFRELYLKHFGDPITGETTQEARRIAQEHITEWTAAWKYPATGDGAPWSLELLQELAADTFEKDMYR